MGLSSIVLSLNRQCIPAAYLILLGMIFDYLDGKVARMMNKPNPSGKYLDSFADFITFGVAPIFLMISNQYLFINKLLIIGLVLYCVCSGFRLIRFCMMPKREGLQSFCGLPSPVAAGCLVSLTLLSQYINQNILSYLFAGTIFLCSLLLVSNIPYKHIAIITNDLSFRNKFILVLGISCLVLLLNLPCIILILFFTYLLIGLELQCLKTKQLFENGTYWAY